LAGHLEFSDGGSTVSVPAVAATGTVVTFGSRTVQWVKLTVDKAQGSNIGLAEFEVYEAQ
jgi:hypothetical protein